MSDIQRLLDVMTALRDPDNGCPWDLEQTYATIVPHTLEEAYEVADTIERNDLDELKNELGDLMFQVVFYAQLAKEDGHFDFNDVVNAVADKLVRRHPHVFGEDQVDDAQAQTRSWEAIKAEERAEKADASEQPSALDDIPLPLPALTRATKLQRRAARVGFDWDNPAPVMGKVREELAELEAEMGDDGDHDSREDELGDLLFACTNLARHLGVDPEQALRRTNAKFEGRFRRLEALLSQRGIDVRDAPFDTLEGAYQEAKAEEKGE